MSGPEFPAWMVLLSAIILAILWTWTVIAVIGVAVWATRVRRALMAHGQWHYIHDGERGAIPEDHDL